MSVHQSYVRTVTRVGEVELIEKITFYPSILPKTDEELWEIIGKEFPLIPREDVRLVKQISGVLDVVPSKPQPKPEDFLEYGEFSISHCTRPDNWKELNEMVRKAFPNVPSENLVPTLGIVHLYVTAKKVVL